MPWQGDGALSASTVIDWADLARASYLQQSRIRRAERAAARYREQVAAALAAGDAKISRCASCGEWTYRLPRRGPRSIYKRTYARHVCPAPYAPSQPTHDGRGPRVVDSPRRSA